MMKIRGDNLFIGVFTIVVMSGIVWAYNWQASRMEKAAHPAPEQFGIGAKTEGIIEDYSQLKLLLARVWEKVNVQDLSSLRWPVAFEYGVQIEKDNQTGMNYQWEGMAGGSTNLEKQFSRDLDRANVQATCSDYGYPLKVTARVRLSKF